MSAVIIELRAHPEHREVTDLKQDWSEDDKERYWHEMQWDVLPAYLQGRKKKP